MEVILGACVDLTCSSGKEEEEVADPLVGKIVNIE